MERTPFQVFLRTLRRHGAVIRRSAEGEFSLSVPDESRRRELQGRLKEFGPQLKEAILSHIGVDVLGESKTVTCQDCEAQVYCGAISGEMLPHSAPDGSRCEGYPL